jgi:hypothetical protein
LNFTKHSGQRTGKRHPFKQQKSSQGNLFPVSSGFEASASQQGDEGATSCTVSQLEPGYVGWKERWGKREAVRFFTSAIRHLRHLNAKACFFFFLKLANQLFGN